MSAESYLIRIDCDPPARLWTGVGDLELPADAVETEAGACYLGGGQIVNVPDFQQLINGIAERLSAGLSGVSPEIVALAIEEAPTVLGALMHIGRVEFDADLQIVSVTWIALFRIDKMTTDRQTGDSPTRSVSLSIGTANTDRSNAPNAYWTAADQARISPTDRFFDHIAGINAGTSRRFGIKGSS